MIILIVHQNIIVIECPTSALEHVHLYVER